MTITDKQEKGFRIASQSGQTARPAIPEAATRARTRAWLAIERGKAEWVGGIKWTIKDGIVYDAKKLLADVARMVEKQKQERLKTAASSQGAQKE